MKLFPLLLCTLLVAPRLSDLLQARVKAVPRQLRQDLTSSYLLGNAPTSMDTSHTQMLANQQKAMGNFKQVNSWLSDLEERLDDLRDTVNRRVSDMAIGMQRRNMLIAHYNYMGEASGNTMGSMGAGNPFSRG